MAKLGILVAVAVFLETVSASSVSTSKITVSPVNETIFRSTLQINYSL